MDVCTYVVILFTTVKLATIQSEPSNISHGVYGIFNMFIATIHEVFKSSRVATRFPSSTLDLPLIYPSAMWFTIQGLNMDFVFLVL